MNRASRAIRAAGPTDEFPVSIERMGKRGPVLRLDQGFDAAFGCCGIPVLYKPESVADPEEMSVCYDTRSSETGARHQIGRFAANSGQFQKLIQGFRNPSGEPLYKDSGQTDKMPGLGSVKPEGMYADLQIRQFRFRQPYGIGPSAE